MNRFNTITLSRKSLYDEIWELSVRGVARKYHLHYQRLLISCKEADIPYPPSGYWTRLNCGKDVSREVIPLPSADIENVTLYLEGFKTEKTKKDRIEPQIEKNNLNGVASVVEVDKSNMESEESSYLENSSVLLFLETNERIRVLKVAGQLEIREKKKLHPQVVKYREIIDSWNKKQKELEKNQYYRSRNNYNSNEQPLFIKDIAPETLLRIYKILDAIFTAVEQLGGRVNSDLSMQIRFDVVKISFIEAQDKVSHELTKKEAKELVEYNDKIKRNAWAYKPQIRKYDHIYNGRLRIRFEDKQFIRDNGNEKIEDRLGEILIALYEKSEESRISRERYEELQRQRRDEERKEEERRNRNVIEVTKTKELVNQAEDYKIACDIRKYIAAVEEVSDGGEEITAWIEWAKQKADWYDPIFNYEDVYLGQRQHSKSREEKEKSLESRGNYYDRLRW